MKTLDARGRSCPEPVIMTKKFFDENPNSSLEILVDMHVAVENITRFAENKGYKVSTTENKEDYSIKITK